ncbi:MAG: VOC family protein [Oscillospiraceae bacterium]|jgi:lactoylglutathione lyase|nr:VOC family protein [Oscillospiraceae bacterium]
MLLNHVSLHVRDLEKSIKFYEDALGYEKQMEMPMPDGSATLVFMGSKDGGAQIELTWLKDQGEKPYDIGEEEVIHLGFVVSGFEEVKAKHKEMNCIVFENPMLGLYFITDPDGYWLEMVPSRI